MNSRSKGAGYERFLVNRIRKVMGFSNRECYRTPMSGGHYALRNCSDITFTANVHLQWPWVVEAKHWKQFRAGNFLALTKEELKCFKQVTDTAARANVEPEVPGLVYRPLLVIKANFRDSYAAFDADYITEAVWYTPHVYFEVHRKPWVAIELEIFLEMVRTRKV